MEMPDGSRDNGSSPLNARLGGKALALVTCMDTRIDSTRFFDIWPSSLYRIRNAGGRVSTDVLRSLVVACAMEIECILVMHHTDCAMAKNSDADIRARLPAAPPGTPEIDLLTIDDPLAALREDVAKIVACPLLPPGLQVEGGIYHLDSRAVQLLPAASAPRP